MNWKRRFAVFKFTLGRGYLLCQLPALSIIGAGVLAPYFPGMRLAYLAIIAFTIFIFAGWLDVKFNILHEEQQYMTEMNPMLMKGLFGDKTIQSAQDIIDSLEEDKPNKNKGCPKCGCIELIQYVREGKLECRECKYKFDIRTDKK